MSEERKFSAQTTTSLTLRYLKRRGAGHRLVVSSITDHCLVPFISDEIMLPPGSVFLFLKMDIWFFIAVTSLG